MGDFNMTRKEMEEYIKDFFNKLKQSTIEDIRK